MEGARVASVKTGPERVGSGNWASMAASLVRQASVSTTVVMPSRIVRSPRSRQGTKPPAAKDVSNPARPVATRR